MPWSSANGNIVTGTYTATESATFPDINYHPEFTPSIGSHHFDHEFACKATATFVWGTSGNVRFSTGSDDGSAIWVDGTLRVNNPGYHAYTTIESSYFHINAGQAYSFVGHYFEQSGGRNWVVRWEPPGSIVTVCASDLLGCVFVRFVAILAPHRTYAHITLRSYCESIWGGGKEFPSLTQSGFTKAVHEATTLTLAQSCVLPVAPLRVWSSIRGGGRYLRFLLQ